MTIRFFAYNTLLFKQKKEGLFPKDNPKRFAFRLHQLNSNDTLATNYCARGENW